MRPRQLTDEERIYSFTLWQRAAWAHPHDVGPADEPDLTCMHLPVMSRSVMFACGIGIEIARIFAGPV